MRRFLRLRCSIKPLAIRKSKYPFSTLQLEEAQRRYHTLFNQAPVGIYLVDPVTLIAVEFNDVACRQLGYSRRGICETSGT